MASLITNYFFYFKNKKLKIGPLQRLGVVQSERYRIKLHTSQK